MIRRLETAHHSNTLATAAHLTPPPPPLQPITLQSISSDKLRVLSECLVEVLLHFIIEFGTKNIAPLHHLFTLDTCTVLFNTLVVSGDNNMQLATCSLLVRMCSFQGWWGDFLAATFSKLYSSQNSKIFPQDRVFFLLTYLGRKSITMGPARSTVLDAILKTLATLLVPLSTTATRGIDDDGDTENTDFQLISWLLLFLSVCLDDGAAAAAAVAAGPTTGANEKKELNSGMRWEFMSGDADMSKARAQTRSNSSARSFVSRCFKKRFLQNKTGGGGSGSMSSMAKGVGGGGSNGGGSSSSAAANYIAANSSSAQQLMSKIFAGPNDKATQVVHITAQIEQALKQQESLIKKHNVKLHNLQCSIDKSKSKLLKNASKLAEAMGGLTAAATAGSSSGGSSGNSNGSGATQTASAATAAADADQSFDKGLRSLKTANTLVVIRGLIGLLLSMDYTCNMDLFLLTCKVRRNLYVMYY